MLRRILSLLSPSPWAWLAVKFSPDGGATDQMVRAVGQAKRTARVLAYSFTSRPIIQALVAARGRGVDVRIVLDKSNTPAAKGGGAVVAAAGIPTRVDPVHAIMHDKVVILDGECLLTGSFNLSAAAESANAENSVPELDPARVALYAANWDLHWSHSHPWGSAAHLATAATERPEF